MFRHFVAFYVRQLHGGNAIGTNVGVPELILTKGSQSAGDLSRKPSVRPALLFPRPGVTSSAKHHRPLAGTKLCCLPVLRDGRQEKTEYKKIRR